MHADFLFELNQLNGLLFNLKPQRSIYVVLDRGSMGSIPSVSLACKPRQPNGKVPSISILQDRGLSWPPPLPVPSLSTEPGMSSLVAEWRVGVAKKANSTPENKKGKRKKNKKRQK
jgi:hypothetical protein